MKTVLIKLSGESLAGANSEKRGIDEGGRGKWCGTDETNEKQWINRELYG